MIEPKDAELIFLRSQVRRLRAVISGVEVIADSLIGRCGEPDCDTCATLTAIQLTIKAGMKPDPEGE